jgi:hypothetical protein
VSYELRAVDRTDLADSTSQLRESLDPVTRTLGATTLTQPPSPANLAVATDNGVPRLTWSQPAVASGAPAIAFYRIYRDGVAIANRYDRTATTDPFYGDSAPGGALSRTYTVTAVDSTMNESEIAARSSDGERLPVTWTRP